MGRCRWLRGLGPRRVGWCSEGLGASATGVLGLVLLACGGNDVGDGTSLNGDGTSPNGDGADGSRVVLNGAVQKGPFIVGSAIRVANLDIGTNPTGAVFSTYTRDDQGQFVLEMAASDVVSIEGAGYYYNEVTGSLSQGPLTLRALFGIGPGRADDVIVNVVTHLTYDRVQALILAGATYDDARAQAEQELKTALGITPPGFVVTLPGAALNLLGGDTDDNAYLFAVSTLLTQAAQLQNANASDAALQELLNLLALDLAATGDIDAGRRAQLVLALGAIDTGDVEAAFAARYPSALVPDMDLVFDQDGDGLVNIADDCAKVANPLQEDLDLDGQGDACDADGDGDGTPDVSDSLPSDPNEWTDADGVNDAVDNCPLVANPLHEDIDLDGQGDACDGDGDGDGTPDVSDSLPSDPNEWTDADGVNDAVDNCLALDNADQTDSDADQVGDACDPDAPTACNALTEGQTQCTEANLEVCSLGSWTVAQVCDFWCTDGACNGCNPGATFCEIAGGSTPVTVYVCDANAQLRKFVSASSAQTCLPGDFPSDTSGLPLETNPPRWVRVIGSR